MAYRKPSEVNYTNYKRIVPALGDQYGGTTKEVSLGYWNGEYRLDIRKWRGGDVGKGISLTADEVRALRKILDEVDFGR